MVYEYTVFTCVSHADARLMPRLHQRNKQLVARNKLLVVGVGRNLLRATSCAGVNAASGIGFLSVYLYVRLSHAGIYQNG